MIVLRNRAFSNEKKDKSKKGDAAKMIAGGAAVGIGGDLAGKKINKESANYLLNSELTAKDKDEIKQKLAKKAKDQGIKVINDPALDNSVYTGNSKLVRRYRDVLAKQFKNRRKEGKGKEAAESLNKMNKSSGDLLRHVGRDRIVIGNGSLSEADVLSHELGHAQYEKAGRSKSVIGKAAHKLMPISKISTSKAGQVGAFAYGVKSGMKNERNKQEGKKSSKWDKAKSVAVPAAVAAPLLVAEGKASLKGLKMMKEAGASKELMKQSRKRLGSAWGTYAGAASRSMAAGGSGEMVGRGIAKLDKKKEDKK